MRVSAQPTATTLMVAWALLAVAGLTLWLVLYAVLFSRLEEARAQHTLYGRFREQLALATAPVGGVVAPGSPVALIRAPAAGIGPTVVVEGTSSEDLRAGPGHRRDSALPGESGVSVVYGRSVTFGGPFDRVASLTPGAAIDVTTARGSFHFVVDRVRHAGDPLPIPPGAGQSRLTLVTAASSGWLGPWTANSTVFVDASLHGKAQPPTGRPLAATGADEQPMASSTASLIALVFCLQLLLLAAVGLTWARLRWGRRQTWLVGLPVLLAVLWITTHSAATLLPNLY